MGMYDHIELKGDIFEPHDKLIELGIDLNKIKFQTKCLVNLLHDFFIEKDQYAIIRISPLTPCLVKWQNIFQLTDVHFYHYAWEDELNALPGIIRVGIDCYANISASIITKLEGDVEITFKNEEQIKFDLVAKPHFYQNIPDILGGNAQPFAELVEKITFLEDKIRMIGNLIYKKKIDKHYNPTASNLADALRDSMLKSFTIIAASCLVNDLEKEGASMEESANKYGWDMEYLKFLKECCPKYFD